jgi:capsular exopolysaccharide synthesis family protein
MNLREVLAALRATWWMPVVGLLLGAAAALALSLTQTPLYTSSTQLFVNVTDPTSTNALQGSQFSQQRVASYARLLSGSQLAARVVDRLNLDVSPGEVRGEIAATTVPGTVFLEVAVTDPSPQRAQQIAEAIGAEFPDMVDQLERPAAGGPSLIKLDVTEAAEVPTVPSSPRVKRNLALGLLVGTLGGALLGIARTRLDRSVKDTEETAQLGGASVIGTIFRDDALAKQHTMDRVPVGRTAESYRQLRTNLQFLNVDDPPRVIMISSSVPAEGKTTLIVNLALMLVEAGQRVILVEADLRKPKVTRYLGMVDGVGLTNVLTGSAAVDDVTQTYRGGLSVLASGPTPPNPGELLASSQMAALLEKLRGQWDFVLVDAPPVLPVADAAGLAPAVDGVVLSVRYGRTRKDQLQQAASTIRHVGADVLGVVLNIVPPKAELAHVTGHNYAYPSEQERSREPGSARRRRRGHASDDG